MAVLLESIAITIFVHLLVELTNTVNTHWVLSTFNWRGVTQEENVNNFVKKLKLATKEKPGTFFLPLLFYTWSLGPAWVLLRTRRMSTTTNTTMSIWSTPLTQQSLMLSHMVLSCCSSCLERPLEPECRESIKFSLICLRWYHIISYHVRRSAITNQRKDVPSGGEGDIL